MMMTRVVPISEDAFLLDKALNGVWREQPVRRPMIRDDEDDPSSLPGHDDGDDRR